MENIIKKIAQQKKFEEDRENALQAYEKKQAETEKKLENELENEVLLFLNENFPISQLKHGESYSVKIGENQVSFTYYAENPAFDTSPEEEGSCVKFVRVSKELEL
jgi:hypothetical protein